MDARWEAFPTWSDGIADRCFGYSASGAPLVPGQRLNVAMK
jgi:hypothetical protein